MGQLIDHQYRGSSPECGIEIEFRTHDPSIFHLEQWQLFEATRQALRFETTMGFDVTDHDIGPRRLGRTRRSEHGVGLPDTRRRAKKYFEAASMGAPRRLG
jgi:hypothetical protein